MGNSLFLGVDVGTTAIKAGVYDEHGKMLAHDRKPMTVIRPAEAWSEQDMNVLWETTLSCLTAAAAQVDASAVRAIGVCGQGDGLWLLDADKKPLRNAILWNDQRAKQQIAEWIEDGTSDKLAEFCRTANWPGTAGAGLRWLADKEPETLDAAAHILFCKDWIGYRLTGEITTDFSDATIPFYDLENERYAPQAFALLGLPDLSDKFAKPRRATEAAGPIRPALAEQLGLSGETVVAVGALDLAGMMTGLGLNKPGDMCFILGTTAVFSYIAPPIASPDAVDGATVHHPFTDNWIRVLAPQSGASAFDWFAGLHPSAFGGLSAGEIAEQINEMAADLAPGSSGVTFLPFLTGERAPFVAPHATASFLGMTSKTSKADMARAVMEGASFSLRHCLHSAAVKPSDTITLTGGGARNKFWCQIMADVLGITIVANAAEDHGLWGAALIGAAAADLADPLRPARVEDNLSYIPDPTAHATYNHLFENYLQMIALSRGIWDIQRKNS
jgi:erythritol kinase